MISINSGCGTHGTHGSTGRGSPNVLQLRPQCPANQESRRLQRPIVEGDSYSGQEAAQERIPCSTWINWLVKLVSNSWLSGTVLFCKLFRVIYHCWWARFSSDLMKDSNLPQWLARTLIVSTTCPVSLTNSRKSSGPDISRQERATSCFTGALPFLW